MRYQIWHMAYRIWTTVILTSIDTIYSHEYFSIIQSKSANRRRSTGRDRSAALIAQRRRLPDRYGRFTGPDHDIHRVARFRRGADRPELHPRHYFGPGRA